MRRLLVSFILYQYVSTTVIVDYWQRERERDRERLIETEGEREREREDKSFDGPLTWILTNA